MYFVTGSGNLSIVLQDLLSKHFGEKAKITTNPSSVCEIWVEVDSNAGFKDEEKRLTKEQIKAMVCGGGIKHGLDGKKFKIIIEEIKDDVD
jgi:hypothetical protein